MDSFLYEHAGYLEAELSAAVAVRLGSTNNDSCSVRYHNSADSYSSF